MEEENNTSSAPESPKRKTLPYLFLGIGFLLVLGLISYFMYLRGTQTASEEITDEISPTVSEEPSVQGIEEEIEISEESVTPVISATSTPSPTNPPPTPTNTPTPTATPTVQPKADLYIREYSYSPAPTPIKEQEFTVRINIYNGGNLASGPFYWEWWSSSAKRVCRFRIDNIAAHGGKIVYCTYTYESWSTYTVKAVADADNEVSESDETNNIRTETLVPIH